VETFRFTYGIIEDFYGLVGEFGEGVNRTSLLNWQAAALEIGTSYRLFMASFSGLSKFLF
jgi:hypothetical protein